MEQIKISASQLSTFRDCPRKWAFDKLDKIPRSETKATQDGTAIHAEIENYYLKGVAPTSKAAQALLQHLPPPGPSIKPESDFFFPWPTEGVIMTGIVDLVDTDTGTIYDHKTTSNIQRYAKSVEDLQIDPQPILYGMHYRVAYGNREKVSLQFTYVQREEPKTRPPHTLPVKFEQDLTDLKKGLEVLTPIVDEIVQIRRGGAKRAVEVRHDTEACYKFGKCPYSSHCPDYIGTANKPKEIVMDFEALRRAKQKAAEQPLPTPSTDLDDGIARPTPTPVANTAPTPTPPTVAASSEPPRMPLLETLAIEFGAAPQVLPPDAQPNVSPLDPPPPPTVKGKGKSTRGILAKHADPTKIPLEAERTAVSTPTIPELRAMALDVVLAALKNGSASEKIQAAAVLLSLK